MPSATSPAEGPNITTEELLALGDQVDDAFAELSEVQKAINEQFYSAVRSASPESSDKFLDAVGEAAVDRALKDRQIELRNRIEAAAAKANFAVAAAFNARRVIDTASETRALAWQQEALDRLGKDTAKE